MISNVFESRSIIIQIRRERGKKATVFDDSRAVILKIHQWRWNGFVHPSLLKRTMQKAWRKSGHLVEVRIEQVATRVDGVEARVVNVRWLHTYNLTSTLPSLYHRFAAFQPVLRVAGFTFAETLHYRNSWNMKFTNLRGKKLRENRIDPFNVVKGNLLLNNFPDEISFGILSTASRFQIFLNF